MDCLITFGKIDDSQRAISFNSTNESCLNCSSSEYQLVDLVPSEQQNASESTVMVHLGGGKLQINKYPFSVYLTRLGEDGNITAQLLNATENIQGKTFKLFRFTCQLILRNRIEPQLH